MAAEIVKPGRRRSGFFRFRWLRVLLIVLGLPLLWLLALAIEIVAYSTVRDDDPADAAIVLGAAAWEGQPSPVFEERIKHAIDLYQAGRVSAIIFTGGMGEGESTAEAIAGSRYAIEQGIALRDVFCETASHFTHENLLGTKAIVEQQHFDRVVIVSDPLHMRRAMTMAHDFGLKAYSSPTPSSRYTSLTSQLGLLWSETWYYALYLISKPWLSTAANDAAMQPCEQ
jgi:uncharacterized SAM-binding protein YcdF (DUF218 family)